MKAIVEDNKLQWYPIYASSGHMQPWGKEDTLVHALIDVLG